MWALFLEHQMRLGCKKSTYAGLQQHHHTEIYVKQR